MSPEFIGRAESIATRVTFRDWWVRLAQKKESLTFQWCFLAPCSRDGGEPTEQRGRKWLLSEHMTDSEIVQTALLAVLVAVEHEAREAFRFDGQPIFGPHFDARALAKLASDPSCRDARRESTP